MKQLKFMLAAAAAFGIATAQADTQLEKKEISSENFDAVTTLEDTAALMALDGFTYEGATATDNESYVVAGGANSTANALKVNTGTDPLLRKIDTDTNNAITLDSTGAKKVYIDTMVQFTVTPASDTVTKSGSDKLMIYLKEMTNDVGVVTGTNLMVKAAKYQPASGTPNRPNYVPESFEAVDVSVSAGGLTVTTDTWYSLEVVASVDNGVPVFSISIGGKQLTSDVILYGTDGTKFPSLLGKQTDSEGNLVATLDKVGFAGEGMVDELVFSHDVEQQTSVDFTFTLAWDAAGFSSVTYTIDGGEPVTPENGGSFTVADGKKLAIAYTLNEWYKISGTPVLEYTAAVNGTGSLTLEAEKVITTESTVDGTVTVNPSATADELAAVKTEAGITGGAFKDSGAEELGKALTWMNKNSVSAENVNAVAFKEAAVTNENGTVETVFVADGSAAEAYLLNCDPTSEVVGKTLQDYKDNFKFDAADLSSLFDLSNVTTETLQNTLFNDKGYNGSIILEGKGELSGEWRVRAVGHKFFRARLVK